MKKIIISFYFFSVILLLLLSYLFIDPNFFYLKSFYTGIYFNQREIVTTAYVFLISSFFVTYLYIYKMFSEKRIRKEVIKRIIFLTCLILFLSYPAMLSFDIFNYAATAKTTFFYMENPYIVMPIEFINDTVLQFMHSANKTALYGPVWIILTAVPSLIIGFSNFIALIFGLKIIVGVFYFLTLVILWKSSRDWIPVLLYALNPLIVIETFVSGHNDVAMMFLVLYSLYLLSKRKFYWSALLLLLSIFIKFATIFLIPIVVYILFLQIKKQKINNEKIFYYSFLSMLAIFFLSSFREEIYPWYAIWFLPFSFLLYKHKVILIFSQALSFGLMLRYVPFMLTGTYFGQTPILKIILMWTPFIFILLVLGFRKIWLKNFYL